MSSQAVSQGVMTATEFVETIRRRCERSGEMPSEAAAFLFNPDMLSPAAIHELAITGAAARAGNGDHADRRTDARRARNGPTSKDKVAFVMTQIQHKGADGKARPLLAFTADDWEAFRATADGLAKGWRERAAVAKTASALLKQHSAATAKDLPLDALRSLDAKVAQAW